MSSRRPALKWLSPQTTRNATNPGLWLDKFLDSSGTDDSQAKHELIKDVTSIAVSDVYNAFYQRWRRALKEQGIEPREATVAGRMVIGLGDESVLETSVTLHHTYGVPYLPGSALKGLAAAYARQRLDGDEWLENGDFYVAVFGDPGNAGFITFYDALYVPADTSGDHALAADVLTVHHQQYYQGGGLPPADWDDPVPVNFLSATGSYLLALGGPAEWVGVAFIILKLALSDYGVGAKTSSGYGRLRVAKPKLPKKAATAESKTPKLVETEEEVVLETDVKSQRAQVRLASGELVTCGSLPGYQPPAIGEKCRAVVGRIGGKAVSARYLR